MANAWEAYKKSNEFRLGKANRKLISRQLAAREEALWQTGDEVDAKRGELVLPTAREKEQDKNILFREIESGPLEGLTLLPSSLEDAARTVGYTAERMGSTLLGGVEAFTDLLGSGIGKAIQGVTSVGGLFPNAVSEWGEDVAEHFLNTSPTQAWEESIERRYNPGQGARNVTGVGQTIMQMVPAIRAASAVSTAGNAVNAAQAASRGANVGRAIMGVQAAGNAASEAAAEGADTNQALAYGLTSGLLETTIESIAGGIPGLGRGKIGEIAEAVKANPIVSRALDIAGEGGEEALSTVLSPYLKRAIYDPDAENATAEEIAQSAVLGAVAAGVLQAGLELPTAVSNTVSDIRRVRQEVGSNQDIIDRANQRIAQDLQARREAANQADTLYIRKKNSQDTVSDNGAEAPSPNRNVQNVPPQSSPVNSIPSGAQNVNIQGVSPNLTGGEAGVVSPVVQRLSQALGRNIQVYDGSLETGAMGAANGYYSNGTIYVNSQSANPVAQIIAHELTHSVEMADAYQELQGLIFDRIRQTGGDLAQLRAQKAELYQRNGVELNAQDLDAEIVAEYVEKNLLTDEAAIEELARTNRTLAQRIRDWIDAILAKLGNTSAQSRVFLERARSAYSRALQQTKGSAQAAPVDGRITLRTYASTQRQSEMQALLDQYDAGSITLEQLLAQATPLMEQEAGGQHSIGYDQGNRPFVTVEEDILDGVPRDQTSGNVNPKYSISEYSDKEKQAHAKAALDYFGKTYNWNETGYITRDGSRVDLSGRHDGGPGGYRTVDHRDISEALGYDYGDGDYSGAMVQFISEGNIRISPESGGIDLSVQPTRAQEQSLEDFISQNRGEVILDIDTPDGNTVTSVEYPRGTHSSKVISDIRNYFTDGAIPQVSEVSRFRYSLDEDQRDQFVSMLRQYARGNWNEQTIREYLDLAQRNGIYAQGANAARPVIVPRRNSEGDPVQRTARTAIGARAIPEEALADIQNMVLRGELSYNRVSDKSSIDRAVRTIREKGYQGALEEFRNDVQRGVVSKDIATLGQQLLINAANAGDSRTTAELLSLYAQMETTAGQAVQAASILRKLDPSDQLYAAQRAVSDLEKVLRKNYKDLDITIDQALLDEFAAQTTQEGRDAVMDRIYQNVADQVPSTWRDKWNAWRYLAMLANPRTHIRNVAGNLFFQPLRIVKDRTAAAIEAGLSKAGVNIERTKSFAASPDLYKAAWNDWQNVKDVLSGNKYDDVRSEINSRRRVFRTAPLEAARTGNSWALELEDSFFKHITYAQTLAEYLQANGVSAEQVRNNTVDAQLMARARDYAGQEALRATYQDRNGFSDLLSSRFREKGFWGKVGNTTIDAILPFRRTPANILVRGFEYSPAGLAKALTADLVQVKQGKISAAQAIDHIAAGLTGSALFALGAYLFSDGWVTSGGGDDENQDRLNELTGGQNYALDLGILPNWIKKPFGIQDGENVTLDWLAPEALPFFMGVELMDSLGQNGFTLDGVMEAMASISGPMMELSMLQSLNDMLDSVSYVDSTKKFPALAASALISYFTQAVPTIGGQIERSGEDTRMSTYTDKNLKLPTDVQYAIGRASARLPGWDYQQVPYIDAWGRREDSGPLWLRTANNFLNPAYTSNSEVTPVDEEIQRLYDETGESGVVPDRPQRYITVNEERIDLSAEQYAQYAEERGQMQFSMLEGLVDSSAYQRLSDTDKAAIVSDVYSYADAVTKSHISDYEPEGWIAKVVESGADPAEYILYKHSLTDGMTLKERSAALERSGITGREKTDLLLAENPEWTEKAREYGVSDRVYVEFKVATSDVSADKDEDGKSVSGSKKKKVMDIIDGMDVSDEVKDSLYYAAGYTESTIDDAPWR